MNDRDRDYTKFSYAAYRSLKKYLGEYDAVLECTELAIREFNELHKAAKSKDEFFEKMSIKHSVNVNVHDFKKNQSRTSQLYIVSVHREFEIFLNDFKKEFKGFNNDYWIAKQDGETLLENAIQNVLNVLGKKFINQELIDTYDYTRP